MGVTRREIFANLGAVPVAFFGLRNALWQGLAGATAPDRAGYGPLVADPERLFDLPAGFSYTVISKSGTRMDDGLLVPGAHDGMAAFPGPGGKTVLVRNHENILGNPADGAFGERNERFRRVDRARVYDAGEEAGPCHGGTTTIVYDTKAKRVERHFMSLLGTLRNCCGGPTPWNTWISCEEAVLTKSETCRKDHGYNFEVPARRLRGAVEPVPLTAMGRFNHEAVAVDPQTGIVYQTEDRRDGLLYRFVPKVHGKLRRGGALQALALRDRTGADTSNWSDKERITAGTRLDVTWVDLENVDSPKDDLRLQGFAKGAARFARGEGMWYGNGAVFVSCTIGGRARKGQIWRYVPAPAVKGEPLAATGGMLELFLEPDDPSVLDNCDNLTVSPWGDLIVCEDGPGAQHLRGVTPQGRVYTFAKNVRSGSELAGATFSPDKSTLFVNLQWLGMTLAITGPWANRHR